MITIVDELGVEITREMSAEEYSDYQAMWEADAQAKIELENLKASAAAKIAQLGLTKEEANAYLSA